MSVVIVDYDSGNLHSALKAFERMAADTNAGDVIVSDDPDVIARADRVVLPGDGAFPACQSALMAKQGVFEALDDAVSRRAVPFLGICVGMQLLATTGHEYTPTPGLDWIGGDVRAIADDGFALKVPHMGWNNLVIEGEHPVLEGVENGDHVYFVHGYHFDVAESSSRLGYVDYGKKITAIIGRDNLLGFQFHPEKSQAIGLKLIHNFLTWVP